MLTCLVISILAHTSLLISVCAIQDDTTSDSSFKKMQTVQNATLRTATGAHKMASIDDLHQKSLTLRIKNHSNILSTQYLGTVWRRTTSVMASQFKSQDP